MAVEPEVAEDLSDLAGPCGAVAADDGDGLVRLHCTALDAADADDAHIGGVVKLGDLHLQRSVSLHIRGSDMVDDGLEQRIHVVGLIIEAELGVAVEGRGVDDREVELLVSRAEVVEEVEHLIHDPVRAGAGTVNLVDYDNGLQAVLECLLGNESGLGHRSVNRVHQEEDGVDHREHALHLAAEVGVARGVDDVDPVVLPVDCGVLREDGDSSFPFNVVGIHDPGLSELGALKGA